MDFKDARVIDTSGVEAIDAITKKYKERGKTLSIRHLSRYCQELLKAAGPYCTYAEDDPTYKIAADEKA
jgi:SulP family sulfate permease